MEKVAGQKVRYGQINHEYGLKLATTPPEEDGPIWMVNLMKYREKADYADGRSADISGREADDLYAPLGPLKAIGAQVVFLAEVDTQFFNDTPKWDRVGIVKYPSRRAFIEMQSRKDFQELHAHKEAGMAATIVCGTLPPPDRDGLVLDAPPLVEAIAHDPRLRALKLIAAPGDDALLPRGAGSSASDADEELRFQSDIRL